MTMIRTNINYVKIMILIPYMHASDKGITENKIYSK